MIFVHLYPYRKNLGFFGNASSLHVHLNDLLVIEEIIYHLSHYLSLEMRFQGFYRLLFFTD